MNNKLRLSIIFFIIALSGLPVNYTQKILYFCSFYLFAFWEGVELYKTGAEKGVRDYRMLFLLSLALYIFYTCIRYNIEAIKNITAEYYRNILWNGTAIGISAIFFVSSWILNREIRHDKNLQIVWGTVLLGVIGSIPNEDMFKVCFISLSGYLALVLGYNWDNRGIIFFNKYRIMVTTCMALAITLSSYRIYYAFFIISMAGNYLCLIYVLPFLKKIVWGGEISRGKEFLSEKTVQRAVLVIGILLAQSKIWNQLLMEIFQVHHMIFVYSISYVITVIVTLYSVRQFVCYKEARIDLTALYIASTPVISMFITEITYNDFWRQIAIVPGIINLSIYVCVFLLLLTVFGNLKISMLLCYILSFAWGLLNSYLIRFKNSPLIPSDLSAAKTGLSVMKRYDYTLNNQNAAGLCLMLIAGCIMILMCRKLEKKKYNWKARILTLGIVVSSCFLTYEFWNVESIIKKDAYFWWLPQNTFYNNGSLAAFVTYSQLLKMEAPEGYSREAADRILEEYDIDSREDISSYPNLIVIMNEALSELKTAGDFSTTEEYMPYWNSLENTIHGFMYVSVYGNYTANTEFEFLTGNSMAFYPNDSVPYQQYVAAPINQGLVDFLRGHNYICHAVHPFGRTGWNRPIVYNYMGFMDFISEEDFHNPIYIRNLISDESSYEKDIELFEKRDRSKPLFVFNVTVQNHGGYWEDTIPDNNIRLLDFSQEYPQVEKYLSLVKESDKALEKLIEYFENVEEPTVIVMFGDHQPGLPDSFYEEISEKPITEWRLDDWQKKYRVPYFIWANYDIQDKEEDISANYLYTQVLDVMGMPKDKYAQFLEELKENVPIINANGYMDKSGKWHTVDEIDDSLPEKEWIKKYQYVQYRWMFDTK
ncbi:LTA synthase family protein [Lachnospiraceae bacterium 62-35]